ncbi:MAG: Mg2 transporter protein CorA family protein [Paenibacillus sp.]|nr:Mg2 transporter protein CorA family protein [Paenibacillus sp.]
MIRQLLRYPSGWEWHLLRQDGDGAQLQKPLPSRKSSAGASPAPNVKRSLPTAETNAAEPSSEFKRQFPECALWMDECASRKTNHIFVDHIGGSDPILCGTLMIQISDDETDIQPFHFWLSRHRLVTIYEDIRLPLSLQTGRHAAKYEECEQAPEAFFIMIGVLLDTFHAGLDGFERRLGELERTMRRRNRTGLLDVIFERRYDLLHWSHLFIPIREVHSAAKEAFSHELIDTEGFIRITHKLERIDALLKHYALEIDTLISMDDAISSFRGNDIMKTLTIFTVLFLPATVVGALWGMNFDQLPWSKQDWGFGVTCGGIAIITIGIYFWLWRKGWTGDLLVKRRQKLKLLELGVEANNERSRASKHGKGKGKRSGSRQDVRAGAGSMSMIQHRESRRDRT